MTTNGTFQALAGCCRAATACGRVWNRSPGKWADLDAAGAVSPSGNSAPRSVPPPSTSARMDDASENRS
jgi:hypothetical protein